MNSFLHIQLIKKYYSIDKTIMNILYNLANNITNNETVCTSVIYGSHNNNEFKVSNPVTYNNEGCYELAKKQIKKMRYNNTTPKLLFTYLLFEAKYKNIFNFYRILTYNTINIENDILITNIKIIVENEQDKVLLTEYLNKTNVINIIKNIANTLIYYEIYNLEEYYYLFDC